MIALDEQTRLSCLQPCAKFLGKGGGNYANEEESHDPKNNKETRTTGTRVLSHFKFFNLLEG